MQTVMQPAMRTHTTARALCASLLLAGSLGAAGCASAEIGTEPKADLLDQDRTWGGFADLDGMSTYDGRIVTLGVFGSDRPGEWLNAGIWPLFDLGLGPIGLRGQILPLEFGIGAGWYTPVPRAEAEQQAREYRARKDGSSSLQMR